MEKLRRYAGVVLSEPLWTEFEELCEYNNMSLTQGTSIAISELLNRHRKERELTLPRELIVAFHDDSMNRKKGKRADESQEEDAPTSSPKTVDDGDVTEP